MWQAIIVGQQYRDRFLRGDAMRVSFGELCDAFEFVNFGGHGEHQAFICKSSGKIYWYSEDTHEFEELPDDLEDEEKYVSIPNRQDLDLGKRLVLDFVHQYLRDDVAEVHRIFNKRGAYARFKGSAHPKGCTRSVV
jgi:hypothetical protein